jgi:cobalt-zinc-cadmium efflux system membrane fusion protein
MLAATLACATQLRAVSDAHAHADDDAHDTPATHGEEASAHSDEVTLTPAAIKNAGIEIAPATQRVLVETVKAPARVALNSEAMAHVGSAVGGRANEIKVRVGDAVKKGDVLILVESAELGEAQSDYLQKQTAVSVAESALEPARDAADRAQSLYDENQGISLSEKQKRVGELKAAEGTLATTRAAAIAAENRLRLLGMTPEQLKTLAASQQIDPTYVIRSPMDGIVLTRELTRGELVSPDEDALLIIADPLVLWVIADVPEARINELAVGSAATVSVPAASETPIAGTVANIGLTLNEGTRAAAVRIEVSNKEGRLMPGMFATVAIASSRSDGTSALVVPVEAVQRVEGRSAVFVPVDDEPNTFAARPVRVGTAIEGFVPVLEGLHAGDEVVVRGSFILKAELGKSEAAHEH